MKLTQYMRRLIIKIAVFFLPFICLQALAWWANALPIFSRDFFGVVMIVVCCCCGLILILASDYLRSCFTNEMQK